MSEREDRILERILQEIENPVLEDPGLDLEGERRRLWREYRELVGLLPYALDPQSPPADLRGEILARAREEKVATDPSPGSVSMLSAGSPRTVGGGARRLGPGLQLVAAVLAVAALGLAALSGWLFRDSQLQEERIARLEAVLSESRNREQGRLAGSVVLDDLGILMTSAGSRICPLRPWGDAPVQPVARGAVYFHPDKRKWLLKARGLEPCDRGSRYALWFLVDGEAVRGGTFEADGLDPVIFSADEMPEGMEAVFLTLESDPSVRQPSGPRVLYGAESREML